MKPMAQLLGLSMCALSNRFLLQSEDQYMARELPDGRCIFYDEGCRIYPVRPRQCRSFPFWLRYLRNENSWRTLSKSCPGIGQGKHHSKTTVLDLLDWEI